MAYVSMPTQLNAMQSRGSGLSSGLPACNGKRLVFSSTDMLWANEAKQTKRLTPPKRSVHLMTLTRWYQCPGTLQLPGSVDPCFAGLGCPKMCCTMWSE